ncbi:MAG: aldose 1-epimerase [Vicinamibacterales bacterium]
MTDQNQPAGADRRTFPKTVGAAAIARGTPAFGQAQTATAKVGMGVDTYSLGARNWTPFQALGLVLGAISVLLVPATVAAQARYSAKTLGDVVQLRDTRTDTVVSVLTAVSNAYELVVKGENILQMTPANIDAMRANPGLRGIPLLAPFANRLDDLALYANGQKYNFDMELGNVRGPIPSHGYLTGANGWKVIEAKADSAGAWVTSKLDFYRYPRYMKQFPFAHTLTMTYRLQDGVLEVRTRIDNLSAEPMPVAIGFHPYFHLTDSVRTDWSLSVPAKTHWIPDARDLPTGETEPAEKYFGPDLKAIPMKNFETKQINEGFTDLERDAQGRGTVSMKGVKQQIDVTLGPKFKTIFVYSAVPSGRGGGAGGGQGRAAGAPRPAAGAAATAPSAAPQTAAAPAASAVSVGAPPAGQAAGAPPIGAPPAAGRAGGRGPAAPPVSTGPDIPMSAKPSTPNPMRGFVAFEPMVGITNALNMAQKGAYKDLQTIAPGAFWQESFWIRATGY